jgi:hypothetical protein
MDGSDPVVALLEAEESRADVAGYAIRLLMTRFGRLRSSTTTPQSRLSCAGSWPGAGPKNCGAAAIPRPCAKRN